MLEAFPAATVVASKVALAYLSALAQRSFAQRAVKGGDTVDLGGGHVLEFVMAPNLHWPDTMFSFDHATSVMYTCDAFGLHYCAEARPRLAVWARGQGSSRASKRPLGSFLRF